MSDIQPQLVTLDRFLHGRLFRIPEYQRNYSWQSKHRNDLFDDIKKITKYESNRSHFMATIVGLRRERINILTTEHQMIEIVDGQQRITTLIIMLKAVAKALHHSEPEREQIANEIEKILVKQDKTSLLLLQTNHDTSHHFANYIRTGNYPSPETAKTRADKELLSAMEECEKFVANWSDDTGRTLEDLITAINNRVSFVFHEISDESLVYTVFEVLNSRGLDVSWFDRLKSMLMAIIFESKTGNTNTVVEEIHRIWTDIYRCVGLRLGLSTESLRFAATLLQPECQNRLLSEEKSVESLLKIARGGIDKVIKVSMWLKDVTEAVDRLAADRRRNSVTRIIQARIVATAIYLSRNLTNEDKEKILHRWENITFRIYGLSRKDARTSVGDYVRLAWRITRQKITMDIIMRKLADIGRNFPIEKAIEEIREIDCYHEWYEHLRYFFFRYEEYLAKKEGQKFDNEQWNRIWASTASKSIEHILPQSTGKFDYIHYLGNLLILPPGLNSKLQDKDPREKIIPYTRTGLLINQDVIEKLPNWGLDTINEREESLLEWAQNEWADSNE